ncbi:MAG: acyl-CoA thioesterase [Bacteroidetes bacterium]|nr:acyl-CoA thioesterase [Bacteroidota bacterium]
MNNYKHKTPIQIRFKDVDAFKHVNNANHFTYLESARVKYFDDVAGEEMNWSKQGIILAKAVVDYKLPILFKDKIFVYTKCSRIGNKSFDLSYLIIKEENRKEIILAEASTVLVCYDYEKGASIPMPEEWKKKINAFEK